MSISKENYELYFLDYHEGRLSASQQSELMDFLARHPELQPEFDGFEQLSLPAEADIVFPDKETMKRGGINSGNYNYYFAAYVSGDLNADEASGVEVFAAGDQKMARELELMKLTLLQSGDEIVFEGKDTLKRPLMSVAHMAAEASDTASGDVSSAGVYTLEQIPQDESRGPVHRRGLLYYFAAAAVVMLMAGMFFLRLPEMALQEYAEEIPAVGDAEPTVAVAEVPSPREDAISPIEPLSVSGPLEVNTSGASGILGSVGAPGSVSAPASSSVSGSVSAPASAPGKRTRTGLDEHRPLLAARMPQRSPRALQTINHIGDASAPEIRTDFEGWHLRNRTDGPFAPAMAESQPTETSLLQFAANQLQQALPVDRNEIDKQLSNTRSSIRAFADQGLSGIGSMAVNALGVESSRDEEGRIRQFAIGNLFAITRK